ncbi:MAG: universal stress protein [Actinobacteria bacterium]|nr:universal stress protein [Actinomycetota bacterium]
MINTIVVPLDGSDLSQAALPIANELAAALDSSIMLLASGWGTTVEELIGYLNDQGASLSVPFESSVVPDTFPATAIANAVSAPDDAIVMATHGRTGFGKALLGSVSEDVLKRSNNPVLLVGPQAKPFTSFKGTTMVVTTDGSPISAMVLPRAARWAKALAMSVVVLSATAANGSPLGSADADTLTNAVESAVGFFTREGIEARSETVVGSDAAIAVSDWANANDVALVAMATHGRGGLARTALGSTTMRTVHNCHCPVLVQKPVG